MNFRFFTWQQKTLLVELIGTGTGSPLVYNSPIFSRFNLKNVHDILRGCLVCVFKQSFSVFKQHSTHFYTLFSPTHIFTNVIKQQFSVFKHMYQTGPKFSIFWNFFLRIEKIINIFLIIEKFKKKKNRNYCVALANFFF